MSGDEERQKRRFRHHYSVSEAEALIPLVTPLADRNPDPPADPSAAGRTTARTPA